MGEFAPFDSMSKRWRRNPFSSEDLGTDLDAPPQEEGGALSSIQEFVGISFNAPADEQPTPRPMEDLSPNSERDNLPAPPDSKAAEDEEGKILNLLLITMQPNAIQ